MSGECDGCCEHTVDCRCETDDITREAVSQYFDKKLLGKLKDYPTTFKRYKKFSDEMIEEYGHFTCMSSETEEKIAEMSYVELHVMAGVTAECMMESYKEIVFENLKKVKEKENAK